MFNDVIGKLILVALAVFIHSEVLAVYWREGKWQYYPQSWSYPYFVTILIMMCLSSLMPFLNSFRFRLQSVLFRLVMSTVLSVPFSNDFLSFALIFAFLIIEGYLYLSEGFALLISISCILSNIMLANLHISLWSKPAGPVDYGSIMMTFTLYGMCAVVGFYLARELRLRAREVKTLHELRESNEQLASININLQHLAAEEKNKTLTTERSRIAREIHDTMAYTLTNLLSLLDAYREVLQANSQEVPEKIVQARGVVRDGLVEIRQVLRGLRPSENTGYKGLSNIKHLVEVFSKACGIKIILNYNDVLHFPNNEIEEVFYRVIQEGLTNAFRHGHASEVYISFHRQLTGIELTVRDNGQGSELMTGGYGLIGIGERVKELEGRVTVISKPGSGFTLRVWLPLKREAQEDGTSTISNCR